MRGTTMEQVFKGIVSTAQNVTHICECRTLLRPQRSQFRIASAENADHLFEPWPSVGSSWPTSFYRCPFWPVRAVERYQGPFDKKLAHPILVASNVVSYRRTEQLLRTSY